MGARTKARKRALDILFESELRGLGSGATLSERREVNEPPVGDYTVTLVEGVTEHAAEIDEAITAYSTDWPIERMPAVDRNILRIGVFELQYVDEVPTAVALSEAVSLARELSTDDSPAFVNGVLAKIAGKSPPAGPSDDLASIGGLTSLRSCCWLRRLQAGCATPSPPLTVVGACRTRLRLARASQAQSSALAAAIRAAGVCRDRAHSKGWRLLGRSTPQLISRSASWLGGSS